MRNYLVLAMLLPLTFACQRSEPDSTSEAQADACEAQITSPQSENKQLRRAIGTPHDDFVSQLKLILNEKKPAIWGCDDSQATTMVMKKSMPTSNLPTLISALNQLFTDTKQPHVQLQGLERDTVVVTVDDPDLLSERMGSTGAMCYLAGVTFTITSLKGVDSVWFDFPEGDHASPGRYDRATYIDMISMTIR